MLPTQILLNNFLYDLAQVTIPTDHVDNAFISQATALERWNDPRLHLIYIGPTVSIYDFLTFFALLKVFSASEQLFHIGGLSNPWQTIYTLVIFTIRTAGNPFRSPSQSCR